MLEKAFCQHIQFKHVKIIVKEKTMVTPSICRLQKKFERENHSCKIVPYIGLSVDIKIDDSENKVLVDSIEILICDDGAGYTIMTPIRIGGDLELNKLAARDLSNLNQKLSASIPDYTLCNIEIANRDSQIAIIISRYVSKMNDNDQDVNNFYTECLSFCTLPLSYYGTLKKRMDSDKTETQSATGACYIATSVYGSYNCPQVWTLRRYRDYNLATTWHGRLFISVYYAISPTLVKLFGHTTWFKKFWKNRLNKIVENLNSQGIRSTPYKDIEW